jgi:hypothetical protein
VKLEPEIVRHKKLQNIGTREAFSFCISDIFLVFPNFKGLNGDFCLSGVLIKN